MSAFRLDLSFPTTTAHFLSGTSNSTAHLPSHVPNLPRWWHYHHHLPHFLLHGPNSSLNPTGFISKTLLSPALSFCLTYAVAAVGPARTTSPWTSLSCVSSATSVFAVNSSPQRFPYTTNWPQGNFAVKQKITV